ncbi:hypothetical protein P171DRAFT_502124 [Karstenula rhodostoma CBS 690.94]|uniref:Rhodopsin domain-containing protein n=1 Tax=Karstenula rhodostoma CBS 690.94 TaxID=1392251 RepID=A0A9P4P9F0_9PLEO|nr:hypothetical protein P171DRAFT_502124 [Karstenula rhodostoma CBS 690.94]
MDSRFAVESWTLYALGVGLVFARLISRLSTLGSIRKFQLHDWTMVLAVVPFTGMVFSANQTFDFNIAAKTTTHGLRMRFLLEEFQVTTVWLLKACLLILYRRIIPTTRSRSKRRLILCVSIYCLMLYILAEALLPLWCTPMREYWNPSGQNTQCLTYRNHAILVLALDTTTILPTFVLPVAFIPTPHKLLQAALGLLGTGVLAFAILARYYVLVQARSSVYMHWYIAEVTLMILFTNLPFLSSLFTTTARGRGKGVALSSWPRECTEGGEVLGWQSRKESAATGESTISMTSRKEMSDSGGPTLRSESEHMRVVATVPLAMVRRISIKDSVQEVEVGGRERRTSSVGLLPPLP